MRIIEHPGALCLDVASRDEALAALEGAAVAEAARHGERINVVVSARGSRLCIATVRGSRGRGGKAFVRCGKSSAEVETIGEALALVRRRLPGMDLEEAA